MPSRKHVVVVKLSDKPFCSDFGMFTEEAEPLMGTQEIVVEVKVYHCYSP
jgi:hypothetical protein